MLNIENLNGLDLKGINEGKKKLTLRAWLMLSITSPPHAKQMGL